MMPFIIVAKNDVCMLLAFGTLSLLYVNTVAQDPPSLGKCVFAKHSIAHTAMDTLKPLIGKRYSVSGEESYNYEIGICEEASSDQMPSLTKSAGALQIDAQGSSHVIGLLTQAEIMGGSNWVSLEYGGGDNYHSHCGLEGRRTVIMITCKSGASQGELVFMEEQKNKTGDCYYLFELEHNAVCPSGPKGLSVGSILVIIFFLVASLYVVAGFVYQRFIAGAKGMEQIPNYSFWKDFGNLTADGCDFVCRSGSKRDQQKQYRGIGDDQLQSNEEDMDDTRDEHLLPM